MDFIGTYIFDSSVGRFESKLDRIWLLDYSQVASPAAARVSLLDTPNNPIDLRAREALRWNWRAYEVKALVNYTDSYKNTDLQPARRVGSRTTVDFESSIKVGEQNNRWLERTEFRFSILNAFNRNPPGLANVAAMIAYDQENADPRRREVRIDVTKMW